MAGAGPAGFQACPALGDARFQALLSPFCGRASILLPTFLAVPDGVDRPRGVWLHLEKFSGAPSAPGLLSVVIGSFGASLGVCYAWGPHGCCVQDIVEEQAQQQEVIEYQPTA